MFWSGELGLWELGRRPGDAGRGETGRGDNGLGNPASSPALGSKFAFAAAVWMVPAKAGFVGEDISWFKDAVLDGIGMPFISAGLMGRWL